MHTFTALYDKLPDAEAAQARLTSLGIVSLDDPGIYDKGHSDFDAEAYSTHEDRGIWGSPKTVFPPDEDRHLHEEHLRRGGYLLTVNVDDAEAAQVHDVLENSNAVDVEEREREYKSSGFVPPVPAARATAAGEEVIPILEEELLVGKRQVERGGVRVRSYTVETPVSESVMLREERVEISRRPVNERLSGAAVFEERTIEETERAEEAVVGKQARVVEEVSLRKDVDERTETIHDSVRRTEVEIENLDPKGSPRRV